MDDLDALSREVAAASDDWLVPGMVTISDRGLFRFFDTDFPDGKFAYWEQYDGLRPDLRDPLTVNALLGADGLVELVGFADYRADVGKAYAHGMDRTTAIARAWIAAHGKEKANA